MNLGIATTGGAFTLFPAGGRDGRFPGGGGGGGGPLMPATTCQLEPSFS